MTPADSVTPAESPAGSGHVWLDGLTGWTIAFYLLVASALGIVLLDDLSPAARATALVALAAVALSHAVLRPCPGPRLAPRNAVHLVIVIVAIAPAVAADPGVSLILVVLYPQVWIHGGSVRTRTGFSVALSAGFALGLLINLGFSPGHLLTVLPTFLLTSVASVVTGVWISRIIQQSVSRAALIEQLEATRASLGAAEHARGVLAERERVAREVHDTLAQGFTSIIMLAQAGPGQLPAIESVARSNLAEARALVAAFAPVDLSDSTLTEALTRLTARFSAETGLPVSLSGSLSGLSRDREVVLLRSAQEALANVRRHACATMVTMVLSGASIEIRDDGAGFSPSSAGGFGLAGMRSRVAEVGGSVSVSSSPGSGTTVKVSVLS